MLKKLSRSWAGYGDGILVATAVKAGIAYFLVVFFVGFTLGTLRVLFVAPLIGAAAAVVFELPFMTAVSWLACGWILGRFAVRGDRAGGLVMGAVAFFLLLAAEAGVSILLGGLTVGQHFALYRTAPALLGLIAQVAFALFPVVRN